MGTSKSGRYINTKGSGRSASDFAIVHSNEGKYTKWTRKNPLIRLISGGHGQKGLNQLDKYGIQYNIVKTYSNGVRVGNIPNHKNKAKTKGLSQSWFPKNWNAKDIKRAGEHVAGLKKNRHAPDGKKIYGIYKSVRVAVIKTHGKISTIFPDSIQPIRRKYDKSHRN